MDIDEFLDQEIQAKKEGIEKKPLPEIGLETKNIIQHYLGLWSKISQEKFKWDSDLYTELVKTSTEIKANLGRSLLTIDRQKNTIKQLMVKARKALDTKDFEAATKLYSEISDMQNKFPDFIVEGKKDLDKEIFQFYEELHDQIDSKFINDFKGSLEKANNFIIDSSSNIAKGNIERAKSSYENALGMYKDLPNGFLSQKIELGNELLAIYKDLSIQEQIKNLQQKLSKRPMPRFKYVSSDDGLKRLSAIIKTRDLKRGRNDSAISNLRTISGTHGKKDTLLPRLIVRKLDRAKVNLQKGLYLEAKKNIDAVLKVDPDNMEAKKILDKIPAEY